MDFRKFILVIGFSILLLSSISACSGISDFMPAPTPTRQVEREASIPADAVKMTLESDENPPLLYSNDYEPPVPVPGLVNTAGAEDSAFVTSDGNSLYFFFTPDVDVPIEQQILDGVTGIYVSHKVDGGWGRPERIILQDPGKLAMDGCEFVQDDILWFCSARVGYTGMHWFTAEYKDGKWQNWRNADFDPSYQVGELHFSRDWHTLYFGSERLGGKGGLDIWTSTLVEGVWQEPINLSEVNSPDSEGWPALNPAEDELWISRNWGIWRSKLMNGQWQEPELIVSPLAGEASIDNDGNVYFTHHFYMNGKMIEADIYVAYKK